MWSSVLFVVSCQVIVALAEDVDRTKFTFQFLEQTHRANPDQNSIISPMAVHTLLSMMYPVAKGDAVREMQHTLGLSEDSEQVQTNVNNLLKSSKNSALNIVFKMYHSKQNELRQELLQTFQNQYQVPLEAVDFKQGQQVADSANAWIDRATDSMIQNLYSANDFAQDDSMLLLNAVTVNAKWELPFLEYATKKDTFHFKNGDHQVDMMNNIAHLRYAETNGLKVVEMPYKEETDLAMLVIMPSSEGTDLKTTIKALNEQVYKDINKNLGRAFLSLHLPKFSVTKKTKAKDILSSMGLNAVFKSGAFDASSKGPFKVSDINQNARIDVNEKGTVAAGVTEMRGIQTSMPIDLVINRPFVYLIRKQSDKEIIFIGHYSHY